MYLKKYPTFQCHYTTSHNHVKSKQIRVTVLRGKDNQDDNSLTDTSKLLLQEE